MSELIHRIGYPMLIQMIIECWNEMLLLILLSIIAIGIGSDKADELRKRVMIPLTRELVFLYLAAFFYNLSDIIIHIKATPHDPRLTPLHIICLPAFRHITQILLDLRQQACVEFRQSDENLDGASDAQGSCGVALI